MQLTNLWLSIRSSQHARHSRFVLITLFSAAAYCDAAANHGSAATGIDSSQARLVLLPDGAVHMPVEDWPPRPHAKDNAEGTDGKDSAGAYDVIHDLGGGGGSTPATIASHGQRQKGLISGVVESLVNIGSTMSFVEKKDMGRRDEGDEGVRGEFVPALDDNPNLTLYYQPVVEPVEPIMFLFPKTPNKAFPCVSPLWAADDPVCNNARAVHALATTNGSENTTFRRFWLVPAGEPCEVRCSKGNWHLKPNVDAMPCTSLLFEEVPSTLTCSCCLPWVSGLLVLLPLVFLGMPCLLMCFVNWNRGAIQQDREVAKDLLEAKQKELTLDAQKEKKAMQGKADDKAGDPAAPK